MAVALTWLEIVRCPLVVEAPTLSNQSEKAMPLGKDVSMSVSRGLLPMTPVLELQVATSVVPTRKVEG